MVYFAQRVTVARVEHLSLLFGTCTLLGQEDSLDVGKNTTLGNGHTSQKLVQFFIIPDGQLKVPWNDTRLLVVPGSIPSQLKDLSCQVLHHSRHVDWSSCTHPLGIVSQPAQGSQLPGTPSQPPCRLELLHPPSWHSFPASSRISAARYSITAAM